MWKFLKWLFGKGEDPKLPPAALPPRAPGIPVGIAPSRAYLTKEILDLLAFIRKGEVTDVGPAGYNVDYAKNSKFGELSRYTLDEVIGLAKSQVRDGEASSAIGGYQFLSKTLIALKQQLGLRGTEKFTVYLQDDLAYTLMVNRGLKTYLSGALPVTQFANSLAKEWASLPVVSAIKGATRQLKPGQSYYAGDGLNKAGHDWKVYLELVKKVKK